ncbi:MAG: TRAP transporter large permease subunit [Xanthobacteraceae bacterium]|nr:MAG: TRAP transporter large permease subunit [Xanthobacteraceae bacterium]
MTGAEILSVALVAGVCAALMLGYPVALTLGGVSLGFALAAGALDLFPLGLLGALPPRIFGVLVNETLMAIPLFIFMGVALERSRVAEDLLEAMARLFGTLRGGLGIAVLVVGVLLAAAKGVVGATTVTMGLIVLPSMLRHGYDPRLAAGTVAATATLAQVFPPATVLVLLGDQIANAWQSAQLAKGVYAPSPVTVTDIFAGALVPGFALVVLYFLFLVAVAWLFPNASPAIAPEPDAPRGLARARDLLRALIAPLALIVAVLGSILGGIATPTEAAAIGAAGALGLAALRNDATRPWPVAVAALALAALMGLRASFDLRAGAAPAAMAAALVLTGALAGSVAVMLARLSRAGLMRDILAKTTQITSMIFVILIGATLFSLVFRGLGGDDLVHRSLAHLPGGPAGAVLTVMLAMFLLGFVMDAFEIIFVIVPIVAPPLLSLHGIDPVWLGVLMAVNLQTSYMHPPLGPTLFYLRSVAPPGMTTRHIYVGIIPFVLIQLAMLVILWVFPALATALPRLLATS